MLLPILIGYRDSIQTIKHSFDDNVTITLIGQIRRDHFEIDQKREILQHREIFWWKTQNSVRPNGLNDGFMYMCRYVLVYVYLAGFLITLSPSGPFVSTSFFRPKPISKATIVKTESATIAFFLLLALSFSPFLFLRYFRAYETCLLTLFHSNDYCKFG